MKPALPEGKTRAARGATVAAIGEIALVERLRRAFVPRSGVVAGPGHDCAVVRQAGPGDEDLVLTSDPVIEGVHFPRSADSAGVGRKAALRVISDLAAAGAEPLWALVDAVAPANMPAAAFMRAMKALNRVSSAYGMSVVGGDTAEGPVFELHVFAVGRSPKGMALLRSGARAGDAIYVTGTLGAGFPARHMSFRPRLREGIWLARNRWATACMDVSDGLDADLRRMTAMSGTGAAIETARLPVSRAARRMKDGIPPVAHALGDGEDYELLFCVSSRKARAFERAWKRAFSLPVTAIGRMTPRAGRIEYADARGAVFNFKGGYEHFTRGR